MPVVDPVSPALAATTQTTKASQNPPAEKWIVPLITEPAPPNEGDSRLMKNLLRKPCLMSHVSTLDCCIQTTNESVSKCMGSGKNSKGFEVLPWILTTSEETGRPMIPIVSWQSDNIHQLYFATFGDRDDSSLKGNATRCFHLNQRHGLAMLTHIKYVNEPQMLHESTSRLFHAIANSIHAAPCQTNNACMNMFDQRITISLLVFSFETVMKLKDDANGCTPAFTSYINKVAENGSLLREAFMDKANGNLVCNPTTHMNNTKSQSDSKSPKTNTDSDSDSDSGSGNEQVLPKITKQGTLPDSQATRGSKTPPNKKTATTLTKECKDANKKSSPANNKANEKANKHPDKSSSRKDAKVTKDAAKSSFIDDKAKESTKQESKRRRDSKSETDSDSKSSDSDSGNTSEDDNEHSRCKRRKNVQDSESEQQLNESDSDSDSDSSEESNEDSENSEDSEDSKDSKDSEDSGNSEDSEDSEDSQDSKQGKQATATRKRLVRQNESSLQRKAMSENSNEDEDDDVDEDEEGEFTPRIFKNGEGKHPRREGEKRQPARQNRSSIAVEIGRVLDQIGALNDHVPVAHADRVKTCADKVKTAMGEYVDGGKVPSVYELLRCQNALTSELSQVIARMSSGPSTETTADNRKIGIEASRIFLYALPKLKDLTTEVAEVATKLHAASGSVNEIYKNTTSAALDLSNAVTAFEMPSGA